MPFRPIRLITSRSRIGAPRSSHHVTRAPSGATMTGASVSSPRNASAASRSGG